jgi:hypothetical protein
MHKTARTALVDAASRRLWPLESKALRARARSRTGLEDFGDPPLEPGLSVLVTSLEHEANLHPLGRFLMHGHLLGLLEMRLRLAEAWRDQLGALATSPIRRPVFITGMPRSGSTFLHELLSQDPNNRSPKVWEVMFPLPAPEAGRGNCDTRVRRANARLWWFRRLAPRADEVHPMRARTPHECVAIHNFTFLSEAFISTCGVRTYERFLRSGRYGPAYAWQRRFLQHLQSRYPTERWVLKSPDHLHALDELFANFPDAVVIHIHRNPLEVLRSSLQLAGVLHGLFGRPGDLNQLRDHEVRVLAERMDRSILFRDRHPELAGRFIDLRYSELASDPIATVFRIYQHLDCPLTQTTLERMRHLIASRSRYRGRQNPTLDDLRVDATAEIPRFRNYCLRFGIPMPSS